MFTGKSLRRGGRLVAAGAALLASAAVLGPASGKPAPSDWKLLAAVADKPDRPVSAKEFARLHALLKPQPGESRWAEIPWLTSLWEARKKAAAQGKPLFVWVISDGHPCGIC